MPVRLLHRKFTVDEYYRMVDAGILTADDRVELIEGDIVHLSPIGSRHAALVDRLVRLLVRAVGEQAIVRVQNPIRLNRYSEPQPDIALLRPRADFYASSHPVCEDTLLVIEVADSSTRTDREVKLPLYAQNGLPEVWLVDVEADAIEVFRSPRSGRYERRIEARSGDSIQPGGLTDVRIDVADIVGPL